MYYFIICTLVLGALYSWFLYKVRNEWILNSTQLESSDTTSPHIHASVIIIVRDEEEHIENCLRSILNNQSDLLTEIIVVNDHSTDKTTDIIRDLEEPKITLLELSEFELLEAYKNKFKKAALHFALTRCNSELILTTDGDCIVGPNWVETMISQQTIHQAHCATGPILMAPTQSLIESFQQIEMIGTMAGTLAGITTDSYYSANAANMLFSRKDYLLFLEQYAHKHASGDDVFFVQWQQNLGKRLCFAFDKEAIVQTGPLEDLGSLYSQRLRWASKTTSYPNLRLTFLMGAVFFFHACILMTLTVGILFWSPVLIFWAIALLLIKAIVDFNLLHTVSPFFGLEYTFSLRSIGLSIVHLCYIVMIGLAGLTVKKYTWKGRKVS